MIYFKIFMLLFLVVPFGMKSMQPQDIEQQGIVTESTLKRRIDDAFDLSRKKYNGTHAEAHAIAAVGILNCALNHEQELKPRDFRRDMLQGILNDKSDLNEEYAFALYRDYPLHVACITDDLEDIVLELLARGANPEQISPRRGTILHYCANAPKNLHKIITVLGQEKTKQLVNCKNLSYGETPLHMAAQSFNKDTLAQLLRVGAEVDSQNSSKKSPLAIVTKAENSFGVPEEIFDQKIKSCLKVLLAHEADIHIGNTKEAYLKSTRQAVVRKAFEECGKLDQLAYLEEK